MRTRRVVNTVFAVAVLLAGTFAQAQPATAQRVVQNGIAYASWWAGEFADPEAAYALENLAATGADWVSVVARNYQATVNSTAIGLTQQCPTDADLTAAVVKAHSLGLKVNLAFDLALIDTYFDLAEIGNGFTTEPQWAAWFSAYRTAALHYAALAQSLGVEQFCVGNGLKGTTHRQADWRALVAAVRATFGGSLTYSAREGEESTIAWWDAVDHIGISGFYALTNRYTPTVDELKAGWVPRLDLLQTLADTWHKGIVFTEIGYRSINGANRAPGDWKGSGTTDVQEQADCYRAFFEAVYAQPWLAGVYWWFWSVDPFQGGCSTDYTPHDKPAEAMLIKWYGGTASALPEPYVPDAARSLTLYSDSLQAGWFDWSWNTQRDLASSEAYTGTHAINALIGPGGGLSFWHAPFASSAYLSVEFWIRAAGPQMPDLQVILYGADGRALGARVVASCRYVVGGALSNSWTRVCIPLTHLHASGQAISRLSIQNRSAQDSAAFWVDEIRLLAGVTQRQYLVSVATR
jgi:hypothetical protein